MVLFNIVQETIKHYASWNLVIYIQCTIKIYRPQWKTFTIVNIYCFNFKSYVHGMYKIRFTYSCVLYTSVSLTLILMYYCNLFPGKINNMFWLWLTNVNRMEFWNKGTLIYRVVFDFGRYKKLKVLIMISLKPNV